MKIPLIARTRLLAGALVFGLACSVLALTAAPAGAAASRPASLSATSALLTAPMVNFKSHRCLGISGGRDNAPAVQWVCDKAPNQIWHWGAANAAGWRQIINGDGQCLGISAGSSVLGARVVGWQCLGTGHQDQYWAVDEVATGVFVVVNYGSGFVLGIAAGSTANGAAVVQWDYTGAHDQWWTSGIL